MTRDEMIHKAFPRGDYGRRLPKTPEHAAQIEQIVDVLLALGLLVADPEPARKVLRKTLEEAGMHKDVVDGVLNTIDFEGLDVVRTP